MTFDKLKYKFRIVELEDGKFTYQYAAKNDPLNAFHTLAGRSLEDVWATAADRFAAPDEVKAHLSNQFVKRVVEQL